MMRSPIAVIATVIMFAAVPASAETPTPKPAAPPIAVAAPRHRHLLDPVEWRRRLCFDRFIVLSRRLANLEMRLDLTPAQRPLWKTWREAVLATGQQVRAACLAAVPRVASHPTALDRQTAQESALAAKLKSLQNERVPLQALYAALTPAQRRIFDLGPSDRRHALDREPRRHAPGHPISPRRNHPR